MWHIVHCGTVDGFKPHSCCPDVLTVVLLSKGEASTFEFPLKFENNKYVMVVVE